MHPTDEKQSSITVLGEHGRDKALSQATVRLAELVRDNGFALRLKVADGVLEPLCTHAGRCFCHAEFGTTQPDEVRELRVKLDAFPQDGDPSRLWAVVQDPFDLLRSLASADAFVFFPCVGGQCAEVAMILSVIANQPSGQQRRVAFVGWLDEEIEMLRVLLHLSGKESWLSSFDPDQAGAAFHFASGVLTREEAENVA
ncbi:MAG: hypothetical protein HY397_02310 [Candidatus Doudnabacteria bacterium]|nr:hypothetical protein [Candidatus Doudnabacteria bacterium]